MVVSGESEGRGGRREWGGEREGYSRLQYPSPLTPHPSPLTPYPCLTCVDTGWWNSSAFSLVANHCNTALHRVSLRYVELTAVQPVSAWDHANRGDDVLVPMTAPLEARETWGGVGEGKGG